MRSWLFGLVLLPLLAQAEIYRWTDTQGRVHFGSRAQAGADADLIVVQPQIIERDQVTREREARVADVFDARRQEQSQARELPGNARHSAIRNVGDCASTWRGWSVVAASIIWTMSSNIGSTAMNS